MNGYKSFQAPHVHVSNCIEISLYRVLQYILEHEKYPKSIFICLCSCTKCTCTLKYFRLNNQMFLPSRIPFIANLSMKEEKKRKPIFSCKSPRTIFCGQIFHLYYYKGQTDLEYASHRVEKWNCGKNCVCSCFESSKSGLIRRFWVRFCFERWLEECWPSHGRASISSFQHWHVGNRKISRKMKTSLEVVHQQLETD